MDKDQTPGHYKPCSEVKVQVRLEDPSSRFGKDIREHLGTLPARQQPFYKPLAPSLQIPGLPQVKGKRGLSD